MKRTTERKWHSWLNGVALTICPSMWRRQRRLWWTSGGGTPLTTPHWPSTARLWRKSAALNSWRCTSRRISPGPPTPCHSPRRHNSAYTFSTGWKEQVSLHPSSPHSTGAPLRVCWPAASLSGTGTAVLLTVRPSSGQWTRLQRSSVPLSHPSWTFSLHDAPAKPTASWRTPPTPPTVSSSSYHQEDGTGASEPAPPDCSTAFYPRPNYPAPLWNPMQTPTSWNMDHLTPPPPPLSKHPPNLTTPKKNCELFCFLFSVQFKCATHRWVGLYKPPVVTHSPLCALDTFHTLPCVHNPTKDSCTTNHLVLFPS